MVAQSVALLEALERSALKNPLRPLPIVSTTASCTEIEAALGSELPPSARKYAEWWGTVVPPNGQDASTQVWLLPGRRKTEKVATSTSDPVDTRADVPTGSRVSCAKMCEKL
jgi:hypothetical protein